MAVKSVIEIDLLDEKFQAFNTQMLALQAILAAMPEQWKKVAKEISEAEKAEAKVLSEEEKAHRAKTRQEKDFHKLLDDRRTALINVARVTGRIAKDMADTAVSVAKWLTLGAIGSGFGLGALASAVSSDRRTAQGLGITQGQLRSAQIYGERYFDANALLGNLADIQSDIRKQPMLSRIGVADSKGKNAAELLPEVVTHLREIYQKYHGQRAIIEATGATQIMPFEDMRRVGNLSDKEFKGFLENLKKGNEAFKTPDALDEAWQTFKQNLQTAGKGIELTLIKGLNALTGPLGELATAISEAIGSFIENPHLKEWIHDFGEGIKTFAAYLKSDEFNKDISTFVDGIGKLAKAVTDVLRWFGVLPALPQDNLAPPDANKPKPGLTPPNKENVDKFLTRPITEKEKASVGSSYHWYTPTQAEGKAGIAERDRSVLKYLEGQGYKTIPALSILASLKAESGVALDPFAVGDKNAKGGPSLGIAQWRPVGQQEFKKMYGHSMVGSLLDRNEPNIDPNQLLMEQIEFLVYQLKNENKSADLKISSAKNIASGIKGMLMFEQPKGWNAPDEINFKLREREAFGSELLNRYNLDSNLLSRDPKDNPAAGKTSFMQTPNVNVSTTLDFKVNVATGADIITQIKAMNPVVGYA